MKKRNFKYWWSAGLIFLFFAQLACRKEPTQWDAHWVAPIGNGRITIEDILGTHRLATDEWGWYHLTLDTTIEDLEWSDVVKIEDTVIAKSYFMPFTLDVPPGVNIINQFQNESFLNTGSAALRKVNLKSGKLKYKLYNHINGQIKCTYELPTAFINGVSLSVNALALPGNAQDPYIMEGEIDLAGCQIDLSGANGFSVNELKSHVVIQTDPNAASDAQVNAGDLVKVEMQLVDPVVSYAKGYFGTEERIFNRDITLLNGLKSGECKLDKAYLNLSVSNFIGMDLFFQLDTCRYFGINGGSTDLIHPILGVNQSIARATETSSGISPTNWQMEISDANSNVITCMESLPLKMNIRAKATFNPFGNVNAYHDFIQTDQMFALRAIADIPLKMAFKEVRLESKVAVSVNDEVLQSGEVRVHVVNAFPFDVVAECYAGDLSSPSHLGTAELPTGDLDIASYEIIPVSQYFVLKCNAEQLAVIKDKGYLTIQWTINTPNFPNLVGFRPGYYLEANAIGDAQVQLTVGD
jgi:hypothetical protein